MKKMSYIITCTATCDLTAEHLAKRGIHWLPFHYRLGNQDLPDDLYQSITAEEFYRRMAAGEDTATSQVNTAEYVACFEGFLKQGMDILHVDLSSGISGTVQSAMSAANHLRPLYPERTIRVVDSLAASSGYGLLLDALADRRDEGMTVDEAADWAEANKLRVNHWFFTTDLTFFIKGGRVSRTAGTFGQILGICPLLNVDYQGRLIPRAKVRSKKRVIRETEKRMEELADKGLDYDGKCYISQSACREDAEALAALIEARFPKLNGRVEINDIGTTIGSHTGPGTVALFFFGQRRVD